MSYAVTRQSNLYDDGAYSVEIAGAWDYIGPGALVEKYPDEFSEWDDPRDAAEAAIRIARAWRADSPGGRVVYTLQMNDICYATVADGMNAAELRQWAQQTWEDVPKCDQCGKPGQDWRLWDDPDGSGYCSEHCCDLAAFAREEYEAELHAELEAIEAERASYWAARDVETVA